MVWGFLTRLYITGNLSNKFQLMKMNINADKKESLNVTLTLLSSYKETVKVVCKYAPGKL